VLALALSAGAWWYARTSIPSAPHDPVTVLIADFDNKTNDPTFDHTLEPMIRLALEGASFINAYDRSRIRRMFGVQPPERLDETAAREVAMKQGIGFVLSGSIESTGDGYTISVKAAQPITGNVAASVKNRASNKEQVPGVVTKMASTIRKALGDKASQTDQLFAMRTISTTSLDVISQYSAGIELQSKGKYEEAREKFLKAVELDPKFGLGYQSLSVNSRNVGKLQDAEMYAKEALRYLDGMTERERFSTRGNYYWNTGDLQQCVKEYGDLIARYAADTVGHNQRAICLGRLRDYRGALEETQKALQILPNHVTYRANLALFAAYSGDFATAEREVRAIQDPTALALQALPLSLTGQGRFQDAAETYRKLATMGASGVSLAASGLGDLALYDGHFSDAVQIFEQGATEDLRSKNADAAALKFAALAYVHLTRGQTAAAVAAADQALLNSKALPVRFLAARVLVEAGAVPKAQALAAALASELATEPQAYGKILEGDIALKKRDVGEAIKILTAANGVLDTWLGHFDLGRAYLEGRAYAQADSEFDRCIKRRGEALSLVDADPTYGYLPPVYYYLGLAREGLHAAGFADSFHEYLNIRGKSTEDPLVIEVRRHVER
jgi:tetratricopeptide (TPR) repeat protein